ncbi:MAG TPA: NB-ARC domain-containing protein, partial [Streptosporangiaceae bacterium]|nr:NB-ARC domain-containing protein [Streptosporangiaceae bacterium]
MADVFISYGRADDEAFVRQLRADLEAGGLRVWWDRAAMESRGRTFLQEIRDAIAAAGRLLLVIGPAAVESGYVRVEWEFALQACKVVVPVLRLGDFSLVPAELARLHCPDFRPGRPAAEALAELIRILSAPVPALARLSGVDPLPASYLPRPEEVDKLAAAVLADVSQPVVITSAGRTVALEGMGGVGKSVLAAAFARACPTRRAFGDGIVWLRVGQHPDLTGLLRLLGGALGDAALDQYTDEMSSRARLSRLAEDRDCLVVLDDVWDVRYATAVVSALGPRSRLLVTTRDSRIGLAQGAAELRLGVLTDAQALTLLASWSGQDPAALPAEARSVARECGNLPLALAMIGALVRGRADRWAAALDRLRHADLDRIALQFPGYAYPDLLKPIQVSVDALPEAARPRYLELAVFSDDVGVPEAALEVLWGTAGLGRADTQELADLLVDRSLALRGDDGRLTLHDLQFDYVRRQVTDLAALHGLLLDAYARRCPDGWASGPDDGYFFSRLVPHLVAAGRPDEARELLRDYGWLAAKLRATDINAVLADYQYVPDDPG